MDRSQETANTKSYWYLQYRLLQGSPTPTCEEGPVENVTVKWELNDSTNHYQKLTTLGIFVLGFCGLGTSKISS